MLLSTEDSISNILLSTEDSNMLLSTEDSNMLLSTEDSKGMEGHISVLKKTILLRDRVPIFYSLFPVLLHFA